MSDNIDINIIVEFECPICFEILNENNIIFLECCNKTCHKSCLVNWYKSNPHNKTCFICNKENTFCNTLIDSSENIIIQNKYNCMNQHLWFKIILTLSIIFIISILFIIIFFLVI